MYGQNFLVVVNGPIQSTNRGHAVYAYPTDSATDSRLDAQGLFGIGRKFET